MRFVTLLSNEEDHSLGSVDDRDYQFDDDERATTTTTTTTTDELQQQQQQLPLLYPKFASSLLRLGFTTPTPIQAAVASEANSNSATARKKKNLLLVAPTGSGKTLAYLLEALRTNNKNGQDHQQQQQQQQGNVLMVAPTRELAVQLLRDTAALLHQDHDEHRDDYNIALAIRGVPYPTKNELFSSSSSNPSSSSFLIGTPEELFQYLWNTIQEENHQDFSSPSIQDDFLSQLSAIILDEADVLLPPADPKLQRLIVETSSKKKGNNNKNSAEERTPQEERKRQEQLRKLRAAKREGKITSTPHHSSSDDHHGASSAKVVTSTDKLLSMIASAKISTITTTTTTTTTSDDDDDGTDATNLVGIPQVLGGSATASRKTLDRLNQSLRASARDAGFPFESIWGSNVQICRPADAMTTTTTKSTMLPEKDGKNDYPASSFLLFEEGQETTTTKQQEDDSSSKSSSLHTIRAVTVPSQVQHKYIQVTKTEASNAEIVLSKIAQVTKVLKPSNALVFLCGEFKKQSQALKKKKNNQNKNQRKRGTSKSRRNAEYKRKKKQQEMEDKFNKGQGKNGISARQACAVLQKHHIEAKPLHVAMGLEGNNKNNNDDENEKDDDTVPPFLVTFEGSARGLHLEGMDVVFVVGRPASAASYLHLAGRVGRATPSKDGNGSIQVRPGTVVSVCTKGSASELEKWTKQIGGTNLQEIILAQP